MIKNDNQIIEKIIDNSGHDFHLTISKLLEEKGWQVKNSPHYNDPVTDTPREIDIIAEKNYIVGGGVFDHVEKTLTIRLIIECKYIKSFVVLWFLEKNMKKAVELAKDNNILRHKEDAYLSYDKSIHHYIQDTDVVKEFDTENDNQNLKKAINQVMHSTLFYSKKDNKNYNTINYPIVIVQNFDKFKKKINQEDTKKFENITNNFEIEIEYTYQDKPEYFLIDVLSKNTIDDFLDYLENNDIKLLRTMLYWENQNEEIKRNRNKQNKPTSYI